jgi:tetratricopeptide (TPR) repeat protein
MRRLSLIALALAALTAAVFWPARHFTFVNYDDGPYVSENSRVQQGLTAANAAWALTAVEFSNWHPLTWLSYMADFEIYGLNPGGFHATNIVFHALNVLLLFGLLVRLKSPLWPSAFVAALFAVHPLHVESVAWIAERKDVLSGFFWLLTLWAYAAYVERPSPARYLLAAAAFILGLMSKPMVVTLPFVLLLLDYWPLGRLNAPAPARKKKGSVPVTPAATPRSLVVEKIPLFLLAAASCAITFLVQRRGGNVVSTETVSSGLRFANAAVSYLRYVEKIFWPTGLAVFYPFIEAPTWLETSAAIAFLAGVSFLAVRWAKRFPYLPVGWFWFLGTLVPVIGLVQVGVQSMADRYTYIPAIGLFVLVAWSVDDVLKESRFRTPAWALLTLAVVPALANTARAQVGYWRDSATLFRHALNVEERNFLAHLNLGNALSDLGDLPGAIAEYERSQQLHPNVVETQNSLGLALLKSGRVPEAQAHFERALAIDPSVEEAHENLGAILMQQGKTSEAIGHFSEAVHLKSVYQSRFNLGLALYQTGRYAEAADQFSEAVRLKPDFAPAHDSLGHAYQKLGRRDDAAREYEATRQLAPQFRGLAEDLKSVARDRAEKK